MADRWPLTGRAEELRVISEALVADVHHGIVLTGLAGVGKTRLARAATDKAARDGWAVYRIAGTTTGRPVTLAAFARWVDDTSTSPLTLARKVFTALTADSAGAPVLLYVDDAHLLDDLSALIVHQLALQGTAKIIATSRTGETAPDAVTALWKDGLLRRLELQALSREESDTLLRTVLDGPVHPDCGKRMFNLSRGNVLFLRHLVDDERDAGRLTVVDGEWRWTGTPLASPSLVEVVELQIGAVSDEVRDVVDIVAIAEPVDRALLATLTAPSAVEDAEERGLIQAGVADDTVYVGHPLYGEIRLSQCGELRLKRLRGRIATAMAGTEAPDPLRLGLLWLESDLPSDPALMSTAANVAAYRLDLDTAERLARAAFEAQPAPLTKLLLAYIHYLHENGAAAEELLDTLEGEEFIALGFVDGVVVRAANLLWPLQNPNAARAVLDEAIALGDEDRNHALRTFLAIAQVTSGTPAEAMSTMAHVDYERLDAYGQVIGYSLETIAFGDTGRMTEAGERAAEAYRVLEESPTESFQSSGIAEFHSFALSAAGCIDEAVDVAEQFYREWSDLPGINRAMAHGAVGMAAIAKGDLPAALRHLNAADDDFGDYGESSGLRYRFRIARTEALARSGDVETAVASLAVATGCRHPAYRYVESAYLLAAAWVSAVQGQIADAREKAMLAAEFARSNGQLAREVLSLQTAVQFSDVTCAERLAELAGAVEGPRAGLAARYASALASNDASGLDLASGAFEKMGDVLAAADAAAQAANCHRLAGRKGSALTSGSRAQSLATKCGGAGSAALGSARVTLPFTRREYEIAKLVAEGLTNKEIAYAVSLSVRTVEGHVYQATVKAGVPSRAELSELMKKFGD